MTARSAACARTTFDPWCLLFLAIALSGKTQTILPHDEPSNLQVQSDLVLINALVTDSRGNPVTGLNASQFHLFEKGQEQVIASCSSEDSPVSVGLVLDTSGSMSVPFGLLKQAAVQFVHTANPADEYFLIRFEQRPEVMVSFTRDTDLLLQRIDQVQVGGSTALFDAVHLAVQQMRHAHHSKKALLIVSDGMDNHSRYTERETKRLLSEVDFPIYTIDVWEPPSGNRYAVQRRDPEVLETIFSPTGGRAYFVGNSHKLVTAAEQISREIRHEYLLSYVPFHSRWDGQFHKVRVTVQPVPGQRWKISHRAGYYAPVR